MIQRVAPLRPSMDGLRRMTEVQPPVRMPDVMDGRGHELATTIIRTNDPEILIDQITQLWKRSQDTFLAIGEYLHNGRTLIEARVVDQNPKLGPKKLESEAARVFKTQFLDRLPFGPTVAHQLESVARCLNIERRISREELPKTYSVAYQVATLTDHQIEEARNAGLLHPDVARADVMAFKRDGKPPSAALVPRAADNRAAVAAMMKAREKLLRRMNKLTAELASVEKKLTEAGVR